MKFFIILLSVSMFACGEVEAEKNEGCPVSSEKYISTHFDCGDYSVEYILCSDENGRHGCVSNPATEVPEVLMGHCASKNICS